MALTPEEMEQIPNAISNAFSELEIGIFEDLIGRIKENNEITGTAEYDIFKLIQLGESEKVIKNYVQKALKITYSEIEEIFGDVFETGYNRDNDLFKAVGADFIAYKDNEPLQQYIAAIKEQTRGTYKNITNTMGFVRQREGTNTWVPLTKYYKDSLTRAVIEITSGSFSYTQVVKKIINEMTNSGIRTIDYASGKTSRIEVAARRAIQTAVTQVAAKVTEQNMEKLHTEYVEVSWHATARPTHQVWQGRVFRWNRNNDADSKTQNITGNREYRPIIRGDSKIIEVRPDKKVDVKKINTYPGDVYVSGNVDIKPRALHEIYTNTVKALKKWDISKDRIPEIRILSKEELKAYGKYDAVNNVVYYIPEIVNKAVAGQKAVTEYHEMWHMKQAEKFRSRGWNITKENYGEYIRELNRECKKTIDVLGINEYNVGKISDYAKKMLDYGRYDEVEAEYMTIIKLKGKEL